MMEVPKGFHWESLGLKMAEVFKAFGDINRMKIIKLLASNPEESLCVVDLAEILKITQPATSQHIRVLKNIGVLVPKRIGNKTYYKINADQLHEYKDIIDHMFKMAFVKCTYDGDCDKCPLKNEC